MNDVSLEIIKGQNDENNAGHQQSRFLLGFHKLILAYKKTAFAVLVFIINLIFKHSKKIISIIVSLLILATSSLLVYSNDQLYTDVINYFDLKDDIEYEVEIDFRNPYHFSYDVADVKIDRKGTSLNNNNDIEEVISLTKVKIDPDSTIIAFQEDAIKGAGSTINYQLSSDYQNLKT